MKTIPKNSLRCLALALSAFLIGIPEAAADFAGGDGSIQNPYEVATAAQLNAVRNHPDAHFVQTADIDLGVAPWNTGSGWTPIGPSSSAFTGTYQGGGFAIKNLRIQRPDNTYIGLFGYLNGATVRNLTLENAEIRGSQYTGALAGMANATLLDNIHVTAITIGGADTGGLAGRLNSACDINFVSFAGDVTGGNNTGGLIGSTVMTSSIRHAWTTGSVQGGNSVGGLIGNFRTSLSGTNCSLADAYSRASVSGESNVGGAIGYTYYSNTSRVYSSGPVSGTGSFIGGFLGRAANVSTLRDCYWDMESSGQTASAGGTGLTTAQIRQKSTFHNFNFFTAWQIEEGVDAPTFRSLSVYSHPATIALTSLEGEGTTEAPYLITNADELYAMRLDLEAHYRLANDVDLAASVIWDSGRGWIPVGVTAATPFKGSLDGAGHAIRNLTINRPMASYQGLFGYLNEAKVRNLRIENASIRGANFTAILAAHPNATVIENAHVDGEISGGNDIGGLAGSLSSACDINFVSSTASIAGGNNTGGLIGSTAMTNSIRHAWTTGSVQGGNSVGGLIGHFRTNLSVGNCSLADAYSHASVSGESNVGGAIGLAYYSNTSRVYSSGAVSGTGSFIGGFLGRASTASTLRDCYWDMESSGQTTSAGGTGLTTAEIRQKSTFHNFNFFTAWQIEEGVGAPTLRGLSVYSHPATIALTSLEGQGTAEAPYLITNADELYAMRLDLEAHYRLANDIDLAASVMWDSGRGWIPVGLTPGAAFRGSLDGAGYAIRNMTINRPPVSYQGLFGCLNEADVRNLRIEDASIRGDHYTGILAGHANDTTIENVHVAGEISAANHTGGLIGRLNSACDLNFVSFAGSVAGGANTGGLVGSTVAANSIRHAWTNGTIRGADFVGGLIGYFRTSLSGTNCSLADAYSRASVSGTASVGGAIGLAYYSNISRVYSSGAVSGTGSHIGGFLGRASTASILRDCYWDVVSSGQATSDGGPGTVGLTTGDMRQRATFDNFNFHTLWKIDEGVDYPQFQDPGLLTSQTLLALIDLEGEGTAESPYLITNADELHAMRLDLDAHYRLANDIDLAASVMWDSGRGWIPVGSSTSGQRFTGTLDGGGYTIRNLTINRPPVSYQGLFGYLDGAEVRNLRVEYASIRSNQYTGILAGYANATVIENVHVAGEISGGSDTGGLIGRIDSACNVNFVSFTGSVAAGSYTGGLLGSTVVANSIRHAWTNGTIRGTDYVGGLIGYFRTSLSGTNCSLADAYSRASVSGTTNVGGAIGLAYYSNTSRVYSSGTVSGTGSYIGGFLGRASNGTALLDCYWDIDGSGLESSAGGSGVIGLNTAAMRERASFQNFNFFTTWRIAEGIDSPKIRDLQSYPALAPLTAADLSGEGTPESPYLITNPAELEAMRTARTAHYRLSNDIDLSGSAAWDGGRGWIPVGSSTAGHRFTGTLDGAGHIIRNLTINRPPVSYQGLFGYLDGAEVRNLRIENASIRGANFTGILAGHANASLIENVHVSGEVSAGSDTGGLIGSLSSGCHLHFVSFAGSVVGGNNTGGLLGSTIVANSIRHAWTTGSVQGTNSVGGLIGNFRTSLSGTNCSLADAYSRASVSGTASVGGAIGLAYYSNTSRVYSSGPVSGTGDFIGGFLGRAANGTVIRDCYWDMDGSGLESSAGGLDVIGLDAAAMRQRESYHNYNFYTAWQIDQGRDAPVFRDIAAHASPDAVMPHHLEGDGSQALPYLITNVSELNAMRLNTEAHYRLANDIDLSATVAWDAGRGWVPVGSFTGTLDGNGHVIRNLTINRPPVSYQGLFGYLDGAEVRNLRIENASIRGANFTAILAGHANASLIENVNVSGEVSGGIETGGLIGSLSSACDINFVSSTASIAGGNNTGGLIGSTMHANSIRHAWTTGSVQGGSSVGGLIGNFRTTLSGTNCSLADAYSQASVSGTTNVGGAIGLAYYSNTSRVYSSGPVSATGDYIGGFLGRASNVVTLVNCYWDVGSSGLASSAGGDGVSGRTTQQMKQQGTFGGWNFTEVWNIEQNLDYPYHRQTSPDMALSPADRNHRNNASTGHKIEVTTNTAWTAIANDPWIVITGGATGRNAGVISYSVETNPSPSLRTGTITVGDGAGMVRTFTVTQAASLGLTPEWAHHDAPASDGHQFTVTGNTDWSATSGSPWIEVTSGASGSDGGTVTYNLADNPSLAPREGVIVVSGGGIDRLFSVIQNSTAAYLQISPDWAEHPAEGTVSETISITANTSWTAISDSDWITVTGGASGDGNGMVTYQLEKSVDHSPRVGHVTISDGIRTVRHKVSQAPQGSVRIDIIDSPVGAGLFAGFGQYRTGERVTLDAWNSASHTFVSWSDGATVLSTHPQFVFTAQAPRTLTANYELRVYTSLYQAGPGGSITGETEQGVVHGGSTIPVFALAEDGAAFAEWSDGRTANPRSDENVRGDFEVTALFRSLGGVAIDWYAGYGIEPTEGETWADLDSLDLTGKGMTLLQEFIAGTDPNDVRSRFTAEPPVIQPGGEITLGWTSAEGRTYGIEWSHDLLVWHELEAAPGEPLRIPADANNGKTNVTIEDPSVTPGAPLLIRVFVAP